MRTLLLGAALLVAACNSDQKLPPPAAEVAPSAAPTPPPLPATPGSVPVVASGHPLDIPTISICSSARRARKKGLPEAAELEARCMDAGGAF